MTDTPNPELPLFAEKEKRERERERESGKEGESGKVGEIAIERGREREVIGIVVSGQEGRDERT